MKRKQIYLTSEIDYNLKRLATREGVTESEIIREALAEYLVRQRADRDPWEKLIGSVQGGASDESQRTDEVVYNALGGSHKL